MIVEITASPGSKRFSLSVRDGRVRAGLRSAAERNRANLELIKELESLTGRPVRILSGLSSRRKRVEIGMSEAEWKEFLRKAGLTSGV